MWPEHCGHCVLGHACLTACLCGVGPFHPHLHSVLVYNSDTACVYRSDASLNGNMGVASTHLQAAAPMLLGMLAFGGRWEQLLPQEVSDALPMRLVSEEVAAAGAKKVHTHTRARARMMGVLEQEQQEWDHHCSLPPCPAASCRVLTDRLAIPAPFPAQKNAIT